ncbi:MAG: hypothetical protein LPK07_00095 [Hymenobacteraceae bacterium]|nr:hypothetical protein [Hymenobacteraceae bacterium]MDX5480063.1 hypothetical protein [Hymenobacteraceae bacterium]
MKLAKGQKDHFFNDEVQAFRVRPEEVKGSLLDCASLKTKSGCMRGNDTAGCNGSASVGELTSRKEPVSDQTTYSDYILYNYGQRHERYFRSSEIDSNEGLKD